jgi:hypothetical protein
LSSSTCDTTKETKTKVLKTIKSQKTVRTLSAYVSDGAKFCLLAGGGVFLYFLPDLPILINSFLGSLFILAIAAAAGLRPSIRGLSHDVILRINYLLRCPNPGMVSTYVPHKPTEHITL